MMFAFLAFFAVQSAEPASQFDFWVGEWACTGRARNAPGADEWTETTATNTIKKILDGKVVEENFTMPGFDGKSHSVFDARNQMWRQTWVDNNGGYMVFEGGYKDGKMTLHQVMHKSAPEGLGFRMVFSDIQKGSLQWDWERTTDGGKTWELQWRLNYRRKATIASERDYSTVDGTVQALYDAVSGPAGQRDWTKLKALFPENGMLRAVVRAQDGTRRLVEMTPDQYIERNTPAFERAPFYEREIHRKTEQFGDVANVWSTYAAAREKDGEPFMRGINTIQMRFDGKRWWIVSILWQSESPDNPLPKQYLPGG